MVLSDYKRDRLTALSYKSYASVTQTFFSHAYEIFTLYSESLWFNSKKRCQFIFVSIEYALFFSALNALQFVFCDFTAVQVHICKHGRKCAEHKYTVQYLVHIHVHINA